MRKKISHGIRRRYHQIKDLFFKLLKTGLTPVKLASALTVGFLCGLFPPLGTHTAMGLGLGFLFRLNQVAVYIGLWISLPFYIALLLPMLRIGEWLFHAKHLNWDTFYASFQTMAQSWDQFVKVLLMYSMSFVHLLIGWIVLSIPIGLAVFLITYFIAKKYYDLQAKKAEV